LSIYSLTVTGTRRHEHITPLLRQLQRILFKLTGFVLQSLAVLAPPYADDCRRSLTVIFALLTPNTRTCVVPGTNTRFGDRIFSNSGPKYGTVYRLLTFCCVLTTF